MLLDPAGVDQAIAVGAGHGGQPSCAAAAGHRPAAGFLSLPAFEDSVPGNAIYRRRTSASLNAFALSHFKYGPLLAADVKNPTDAADAFSQAFFGWCRRQIPVCKRLNFSPRLMDVSAVEDAIMYLMERDEFSDSAPLYLAIEMENESIYTIGDAAAQLSDSHPLLVYTTLQLIDLAGFKSVFVRSPGWYLYEYACYYWDGDTSLSDDDAREIILDSGAEEGDIKHYLPSTVLPDLYPDAFRKPDRIPGRRTRSSMLSEAELLALRKKCRGLPRLVCTELIWITRLLRQLGKRFPLSEGFRGNPVYAGCSIVFESTDRATTVIDDFFNMAAQGGDYSTYNSFIPMASTAAAIRRQYRDWALTFQLTRHLDRLLALVSISV